VDGLGVTLGSSVESGEIVADLCVFCLNRIGMRFGLYVPVLWQDVIGAVMVGGVNIRSEVVQE